MKLVPLVVASLTLTVAGARAAEAAEWLFCTAPSNKERKIYMTQPFFTNVSMEATERSYHLLLDKSNRHHDSVQCPRGANEQAIRTMRTYAENFNQQMGMEVIAVDWQPAAGR